MDASRQPAKHPHRLEFRSVDVYVSRPRYLVLVLRLETDVVDAATRLHLLAEESERHKLFCSSLVSGNQRLDKPSLALSSDKSSRKSWVKSPSKLSSSGGGLLVNWRLPSLVPVVAGQQSELLFGAVRRWSHLVVCGLLPHQLAAGFMLKDVDMLFMNVLLA